MEKLLLIIKREFLSKVKNKSFIVITVLSPVLMVAMVALIVFIQNSSQNEFKTIAYQDTEKIFIEVFQDSENEKYVDLSEFSFEKAKTFTEESNYYGLISIPNMAELEKLEKSISFYSEESVSMIFLAGLESKFSEKIRNLKLQKLNIDLQKIEDSNTKVTIKTTNFSGEHSSKMSSMLKMAFGGAMGYMIFMFIVIYGNSVMRSVIEEKTNRIIEVIISSVRPFYLMLGKILGNALAGLLQFAIWIISASVLMFVLSSFFGVDTAAVQSPGITPEMTEELMNSSNMDLGLIIKEIFALPLWSMLFSFLFYFLGGYLVYSSIYAAIGAAVDSETDTQQFMLPVLTPLIIAIYAGFSIIENPHGSIAIGFSLFPLTSPIVMLMRLPFGVPAWQLILSMFLLVLCFVFIVFVAAKIYRIGILMYGKKPSYKDIWKWLRM
ncbi:MAG: ABC-2 type transport system permease protein [Planctomycetota bacterium]|jgi:ABC-2 type transport system permease protein